MLLASCVSISPEEQAKIDAEYELSSVCSDITDSFNDVLEKNKDLLRYDDALENYASTGLYGDTGFNASAPSNYFSSYDSALSELNSVNMTLSGPTNILRNPLRELIEIVENPGATVSSMGDIYTSKWNARVNEMNRLSDVLNALCESDQTVREGAIYSASESCNLQCQFSLDSKVSNVLAPSDSTAEKTGFGNWEYKTKVGSVSDVSKYYLSTLSEKGWKFQSEESRLDPVGDTDDEFMVSQVWCRTKPNYLNLLLIVSDSIQTPGTTSIILGTDTDKSFGCK